MTEKRRQYTKEFKLDAISLAPLSVEPIIVDYGVLRMDLGYLSHDAHIQGEYIFERIQQLNIFPG